MGEPRPWTDADRELLAGVLDDELGLRTDVHAPVAAAVLDALTAAGWRRVTGVIRIDQTLTADEAEQIKAAIRRALTSPAAFEMHVRRPPWWRRLLGGSKADG